jgi:hypothetical protein
LAGGGKPEGAAVSLQASRRQAFIQETSHGDEIDQ